MRIMFFRLFCFSPTNPGKRANEGHHTHDENVCACTTYSRISPMSVYIVVEEPPPLALSWALLGPSWGSLGAFLHHLGAMLGAIAGSWGHLEAILLPKMSQNTEMPETAQFFAGFFGHQAAATGVLGTWGCGPSFFNFLTCQSVFGSFFLLLSIFIFVCFLIFNSFHRAVISH